MYASATTRDAKLEAVHAQLTSAVEALVSGEDWKRALTFAAQFRSRSFNNTLLIYAQHYAAYGEGRVPKPTPTYVAGFHQWLSLGRHVEKGQRGYGILAPVTARFASRNPAEDTSWHRLGRGERPAPGLRAALRRSWMRAITSEMKNSTTIGTAISVMVNGSVEGVAAAAKTKMPMMIQGR